MVTILLRKVSPFFHHFSSVFWKNNYCLLHYLSNFFPPKFTAYCYLSNFFICYCYLSKFFCYCTHACFDDFDKKFGPIYINKVLKQFGFWWCSRGLEVQSSKVRDVQSSVFWCSFHLYLLDCFFHDFLLCFIVLPPAMCRRLALALVGLTWL